MTNIFLSIVSVTLMLVVLGILLHNLLRRQWDALSWRGLFLLGFLHFVALSSYWTSRGIVTKGVPVEGRGMTMMAVAEVLFLLCFIPATWLGVRTRWGLRLLPRLEHAVTAPGIVAASLTLIGISVAASGIIGMGYLSAILYLVRAPCAGAAVALATYYLISRRFNPAAWTLFLSVFAIAVLVSIVGTTTRRPLVGVLLAIPWMWYWVIWRYRGAGVNLTRLSAGLAVGVLLVLMYTPLRHVGAGQFGAGATVEHRTQQLRELMNDPLGVITRDVVDNILYTDTSPNTLFIVENYPTLYPYRPFGAAYWIASNPIPRAWWPNKPEALGVSLQKQMFTPANLGPGIIGHGWAEGGLLGVSLYGLFFGLFAGAMDRALRERAGNPYFLAMVGCLLGNVFSMPRGDVGLFLLEVIAGMAGTSLVLGVLNLVYGPVARAFPPLLPASWRALLGQSEDDHGEEAPGYGEEYDGYGHEPAS